MLRLADSRSARCDSIGDGWTRPHDALDWWMTAAHRRVPASPHPDWFDDLPPAVPVLKEYSPERRRREEYATLGFITDAHPMQLHADGLRGSGSAAAPSCTGTSASTS